MVDVTRKKGAWSEDETAVVRRYYPDGGSAACLPHLPGRTRNQVSDRAARLGIRCPTRTDRMRKGFVRPWSDAEIAYLRKNGGVMRAIDIAMKLGRTADSIRVRLHALRREERDELPDRDDVVTAHRDGKDWDQEEVDFLRANPGVHADRLARRLSRSPQAVAEMLDRVRRQDAAGKFEALDPRYALPIAPDDGHRHDPPHATDALPGTAEKVRVMAARCVAGYLPHHPHDASARPVYLDLVYTRPSPIAGYRIQTHRRGA